MAGSGDYLSIGGGKLYIEKYTTGVLGDRFEFGLTENLMLSGGVEFKDHYNTESNEARLDKKVPIKRNVGIKFTSTEISPDMLSLAYLGTKNSTAQTGATITKGEYVVQKNGIYVVPHQGLSDVVVQDETDTTTYVLGTDYTVDLEGGIFKILEGGAIVNDDEIHLTYDYDTRTIISVDTFTSDILEARMMFESDPQSGKRYRYLFHKVTIAQTGDQSLKGQDYMTLSFEGEVMYDDSQETGSKFFTVTQVGA